MPEPKQKKKYYFENGGGTTGKKSGERYSWNARAVVTADEGDFGHLKKGDAVAYNAAKHGELVSPEAAYSKVKPLPDPDE